MFTTIVTINADRFELAAEEISELEDLLWDVVT
jgi:hypothetical protein